MSALQHRKILDPARTLMTLSDGSCWDLSTPPKACDVNIQALCASIACINRYNGHTSDGVNNICLSVAQHCLIVAEILKREGPLVQLYGLIHDLPKAITGDLAMPMKNAFQDFHALFEIMWRQFEKTQSISIYEALGLEFPAPENIEKLVKAADIAAVSIEFRDYMNPTVLDPRTRAAIDAIPMPIIRPQKPMVPQLAEEKYMDQLLHLIMHAGAEGPATEPLIQRVYGYTEE